MRLRNINRKEQGYNNIEIEINFMPHLQSKTHNWGRMFCLENLFKKKSKHDSIDDWFKVGFMKSVVLFNYYLGSKANTHISGTYANYKT